MPRCSPALAVVLAGRGGRGPPIIGYALIFNLLLAIPGGILVLAGLFGWAMEPADDPEKHHDDHHEHTPGAELAVTGVEETGNG